MNTIVFILTSQYNDARMNTNERIQMNTYKYKKKGRFKMEDVKKLEKDLNDSKMALFDVSVNLEELGTALNEVLNAYDTDFELNHTDLEKYAKGDWNNKIGKQSYKTLYEHDRIMWFVRTAKMYCEQAQKICENVEL